MRLSLDTNADTVRVCCYKVSFIRLLLSWVLTQVSLRLNFLLGCAAWSMSGGLVLQVGIMGMGLQVFVNHNFFTDTFLSKQVINNFAIVQPP